MKSFILISAALLSVLACAGDKDNAFGVDLTGKDKVKVPKPDMTDHERDVVTKWCILAKNGKAGPRSPEHDDLIEVQKSLREKLCAAPGSWKAEDVDARVKVVDDLKKIDKFAIANIGLASDLMDAINTYVATYDDNVEEFIKRFRSADRFGLMDSNDSARHIVAMFLEHPKYAKADKKQQADFVRNYLAPRLPASVKKSLLELADDLRK